MSTLLQSMQAAIAHHQAGRLDHAEKMYREVLTHTPGQADAMHLIGVLAHQQGQHALAISHIKAAIDKNGQVASYYNNLGAAQRAAGRFGAAAKSFNNALGLEPASESTWHNLTVVLDHLDDPVILEDALDRWVLAMPTSAQARQQRAAQHTANDRITQAVSDLHMCAQLNPHSSEPLLQAAILLHQTGDDTGSIRDFKAARDRYFKHAQLGLSTVQSKLDHDIEQVRWLVEHGHVPHQFTEIAQAYEAVRERLYGDGSDALQSRHLDPQSQALMSRWYNRPIHVESCPARPEGALSQAFDGTAAEARYNQSQPGITWADDLLTPAALADLRRFCMGSTIWTDFRYTGGYVGTALANGFANGLLLQIARELRERMPHVVGPHPLRQMWAYKYDQRLTGIGPHADSAAVNVNFWITPESANRDPHTGGLVVWRRCAPLDWDFDAFNRQPEAIMEWTRSTGAEEIHVPYRCNRAVLFDSNLVHRTGDLDFEPGYDNRRVNITMLFGVRGKLD